MKVFFSLRQFSLTALLSYVALLCGGMAFLAGAVDYRGLLVHCSQRESLLLLSFSTGCCSLAATIGAFRWDRVVAFLGPSTADALGSWSCSSFSPSFTNESDRGFPPALRGST